MKRIAGNWKNYSDAVSEAFRTKNMHNPSVRWTADAGFFATPDSSLVPLSEGEIEICRAYYSNGGRSMSGSRSEYRNTKRALALVLDGSEPDFGSAWITVTV